MKVHVHNAFSSLAHCSPRPALPCVPKRFCARAVLAVYAFKNEQEFPDDRIFVPATGTYYGFDVQGASAVRTPRGRRPRLSWPLVCIIAAVLTTRPSLPPTPPLRSRHGRCRQ